VKYMILVYNNPTVWEHPLYLHQERVPSPQEQDAYMKEMVSLMTEISQSGELGPTHVLGDPALTKTIRLQSESLAISDGPFIESKEQMAGWFVVDCETEARVAEIASRIPDLRHGAVVEIRPVP
jgi:hypothetical protein